MRRRGSADGAVMALPGVCTSGRLTSLENTLVAEKAGNAARDRAELTFRLVPVKRNIWTSKKLNMDLIS